MTTIVRCIKYQLNFNDITYFQVFAQLKYIFFRYSVKTDLNTGGAVSRLYIANANRQDSGNYTCSLADVALTTVAVHVLNGKLIIHFSTIL